MSYSEKIDICFVVDTTGSMSDDIAAVRDNLFRIVDKIIEARPELQIRFALVSYRDHPPEEKSYVTKLHDFTPNVKEIHKFISNLHAKGGGDGPEAVADGLHVANEKLNWASDAYKVLTLIGDAPPHGRKYSNTKNDHWPDGCPKGLDPIDEVKKLSERFGETFFLFTVGCNDYAQDAFMKIASSIKNGTYYSLDQASHLPDRILEILEHIGGLIDQDKKVLQYYESHDGVMDLEKAAEEIGLELRELKISLSRLLELGMIPSWPKHSMITPEKMNLSYSYPEIPAILPSEKPVQMKMIIANPSPVSIDLDIKVEVIAEIGSHLLYEGSVKVLARGDEEIKMTVTIPKAFRKIKSEIKFTVFYKGKELETYSKAIRSY